MALVELTRNPEIVLPAMACIVVAHITVANGFRLPSIFQAQATMLGQDLHRNAMSLTLSRASVESVMSRNFVTTERYLTVTQANALLTQKPDWILIKDEDNNLLLSAADLSRALASSDVESTQDQLDLKSIPGERKNIAKVTWQATLDEAFDIIAREHVEALYVVRVPAPLVEHPVGIVLPTDIERFYKS
jgi:CIC family chloride channel protein